MRAWKRSLLAVCLLLLILPVLLGGLAFGLPCQYEETFLGELKYKHERLTQTEGRRIITIGGSAVAFGQNSALLEEELPDYTAVNFGMYAALGTKVMLDLSLPHIRSGDLVILSPEQNEQTLSDYFNAEMMWQALDGAFSMLLDIDTADYEALLGAFPYFAADKIGYCLTEPPRGTDVYARRVFNEFGDVAYARRAQNVMPEGVDANMPVSFDPELLSPDFLEILNEFAAACTRKGAQVYYRFCPVNASAITAPCDLDGYYDCLRSSLTFPILGNPHRSVLEKEWFFDTNFHLNESGALLNTLYLVQDLKLALGDTSPTEIPVPDKPALSTPEIPVGDDSHAQYFRYAAEENGLRIVGLTQAGETLKRLIVPTHANGQPVVALDAAAFAGNSVIQTVVLQENIRQIEDGSFAGCSALTRIELRHTRPESCSVGAGLLDGTQAYVYVRADLLADYASNYFWSRYTARLRPYEVQP